MQNAPVFGSSVLEYSKVRRHRRTMFSVPIKIHLPTSRGGRTLRGISLDISKGGLGALVHNKLAVDETVEIDMRLAGGTTLAVAVVRHSSKVACGFEFTGLKSEELKRIESLEERNGPGFLSRVSRSVR
jgi:c-di-GMP-binding flagellar brake protein YcgR